MPNTAVASSIFWRTTSRGGRAPCRALIGRRLSDVLANTVRPEFAMNAPSYVFRLPHDVADTPALFCRALKRIRLGALPLIMISASWCLALALFFDTSCRRSFCFIPVAFAVSRTTNVYARVSVLFYAWLVALGITFRSTLVILRFTSLMLDMTLICITNLSMGFCC